MFREAGAKDREARGKFYFVSRTFRAAGGKDRAMRESFWRAGESFQPPLEKEEHHGSKSKCILSAGRR